MDFSYENLTAFFDNLGVYLFARQGDLQVIEEQLEEINKYFDDRSSMKEKELFTQKISKVSNMLKIVQKHVDYLASKFNKE